MRQQFGMLVDPLTLKSEGWLWIRKPKNLSLLVTFLWLSMRIIIYHSPTLGLVACPSFVYLCDSFPTTDWNLQSVFAFLLHSGFAFQFCIPLFVSFSGLNFSRNYLCFASIFFQLCAANRNKSIYGFHAARWSIGLLKAFWRWFSSSLGGTCDRSLEGIIFPSTWGCLGKENSKDAPNFATPPARPFCDFLLPVVSPAAFRNELIGKKCLRLVQGALFETRNKWWNDLDLLRVVHTSTPCWSKNMFIIRNFSNFSFLFW